jgi:NAD(P)H-quinone oxidoreductase subunit 6
MGNPAIGGLVFYLLAAFTLAGAAWVAFGRNIVHSAFALFATFFGVAALYAFLSADLMAIVQLMIYVGGVLVLILFAVMLTSRISDVRLSNPAFGRLAGGLILVAVAGLVAFIAIRLLGHVALPSRAEPTTAPLGRALLTTYVLPFEAISLLLLAVLLGAVALARGRRRGEEE